MALPIINGLFPEGLSLHGAVRLAASLDRDPADLPWFTLEACFELVRRERALLAPSRFVAAFAYDHLLVPRMVQEKVRASGAPAGDLYELEAAAWFKADQQWTWPRPETIADLLAYADAYWAGLPNPRGCC